MGGQAGGEMKLTFCVLCGTTEGLEHHHAVPKSKGGTNDESNLITLCGAHHGALHYMSNRADISALTKAALAKLKDSGVKLGPHKANTTAAHAASRARWVKFRAAKSGA